MYSFSAANSPGSTTKLVDGVTKLTDQNGAFAVSRFFATLRRDRGTPSPVQIQFPRCFYRHNPARSPTKNDHVQRLLQDR